MHKDSEDIPIRSGDYHAIHSAPVHHHSHTAHTTKPSNPPNHEIT